MVAQASFSWSSLAGVAENRDVRLSRTIVTSRGHLPITQWEEQMTGGHRTVTASHNI